MLLSPFARAAADCSFSLSLFLLPPLQLSNHHRAEIESAIGGSNGTFEPVAMRTQVVAGTNYFVKVREETGHTRRGNGMGKADLESCSLISPLFFLHSLFLQIKVGDNKYAHARMWHKLDGTSQLSQASSATEADEL